MIHKRHLLLSACLTLLSTAVHADFVEEDDELQEESISDEIAANEIADASMYPVIAEECPQMSDKMRKMHHYVLFGEMLYLKPYLGSTPWMYLENNTGLNDPALPTTSFETISEKIKNIDMDFAFGFRVGLGFNTTWLKLENQLTWMRLHTQTSHHLSPLTSIVPTVSPDDTFHQPLVYLPFWFDLRNVSPPGQILSAKEKTKLGWDQIDWVVKIPLTPFKRAAFSPLLGVRGLISEIKSHQTQVFAANGITFSTTPPLNTSTTNLKERFNAIGLVAGLDSDINFGQGFHLSALLDAALVYGNLKTSNHSSSNVPVIPTVLAPQEYKTSDQNNKFKPILDARATLSWNRNFCHSKLTLNIHLGYEIHFMPRFIEFIRVIDAGDTPYYYDLMLQGLNAGLGLSF